MSPNKILIERIAADLCADPYFAGFKFRKTGSLLYRKENGVNQRISLSRQVFSYDTDIRAYCSIRFDDLHTWWKRHSVDPIDIQREQETFTSYDARYYAKVKVPEATVFNNDGKNYHKEFDDFRKNVIRYAEKFFETYGTLAKLYEQIVIPTIEGDLPFMSIREMFRDLVLCKIVSPDTYPVLKDMAEQTIEQWHKENDPDLGAYYDRIPEIFADLESYDFEKPVKSTPYYTLHQPPKKPKKISLLSNVEKEKRSNNARRIIAKRYGFQQRDWANWMIRDGYYFSVLNLIGESYIKVKPLYVDDLFWDIVEMYDNKNAPLSLRAIGAFAVDSDQLESYDQPLGYDSDDEDFTEENAIKQWDNIFRQINDDVERFLKENPDAEAFDIKKREQGDQIPRLMMLCHHERYSEALQLIDEEEAAGRSSSISRQQRDKSSKDSYVYIREYCERQLQKQNKDNDHKLLHFLFRRNK